jgi:hypothetical protein
MKCFACNSDQPETVTLWDGNNYCIACTGSVHKDLFVYAQHHPTVVSNYRTLLGIHEMLYIAKIHIVGIVFALGILFAAVPLGQNAPPLKDLFLLFSFFSVILIIMLPGNVFLYILRELWRHPHIEICDGKVSVTFWINSNLYPLITKKNIVIPLASVKTQILPLKYDICFPLVSRSNKNLYCLLDFSDCIEESFPCIIDYNIPFRKNASIKRWRESPYLCFASSRFENAIIVAFFDILQQTSVESK